MEESTIPSHDINMSNDYAMHLMAPRKIDSMPPVVRGGTYVLNTFTSTTSLTALQSTLAGDTKTITNGDIFTMQPCHPVPIFSMSRADPLEAQSVTDPLYPTVSIVLQSEGIIIPYVDSTKSFFQNTDITSIYDFNMVTACTTDFGLTTVSGQKNVNTTATGNFVQTLNGLRDILNSNMTDEGLTTFDALESHQLTYPVRLCAGPEHHISESVSSQPKSQNPYDFGDDVLVQSTYTFTSVNGLAGDTWVLASREGMTMRPATGELKGTSPTIIPQSYLAGRLSLNISGQPTFSDNGTEIIYPDTPFVYAVYLGSSSTPTTAPALKMKIRSQQGYGETDWPMRLSQSSGKETYTLCFIFVTFPNATTDFTRPAVNCSKITLSGPRRMMDAAAVIRFDGVTEDSVVTFNTTVAVAGVQNFAAMRIRKSSPDDFIETTTSQQKHAVRGFVSEGSKMSRIIKSDTMLLMGSHIDDMICDPDHVGAELHPIPAHVAEMKGGKFKRWWRERALPKLRKAGPVLRRVFTPIANAIIPGSGTAIGMLTDAAKATKRVLGADAESRPPKRAAMMGKWWDADSSDSDQSDDETDSVDRTMDHITGRVPLEPRPASQAVHRIADEEAISKASELTSTYINLCPRFVLENIHATMPSLLESTTQMINAALWHIAHAILLKYVPKELTGVWVTPDCHPSFLLSLDATDIASAYALHPEHIDSFISNSELALRRIESIVNPKPRKALMHGRPVPLDTDFRISAEKIKPPEFMESTAPLFSISIAAYQQRCQNNQMTITPYPRKLNNSSDLTKPNYGQPHVRTVMCGIVDGMPVPITLRTTNQPIKYEDGSEPSYYKVSWLHSETMSAGTLYFDTVGFRTYFVDEDLIHHLIAPLVQAFQASECYFTVLNQKYELSGPSLLLAMQMGYLNIDTTHLTFTGQLHQTPIGLEVLPVESLAQKIYMTLGAEKILIGPPPDQSERKILDIDICMTADEIGYSKMTQNPAYISCRTLTDVLSAIKFAQGILKVAITEEELVAQNQLIQTSKAAQEQVDNRKTSELGLYTRSDTGRLVPKPESEVARITSQTFEFLTNAGTQRGNLMDTKWWSQNLQNEMELAKMTTATIRRHIESANIDKLKAIATGLINRRTPKKKTAKTGKAPTFKRKATANELQAALERMGFTASLKRPEPRSESSISTHSVPRVLDEAMEPDEY